jgi:predicted  nucleic acid-binding Zn-ribbon protein
VENLIDIKLRGVMKKFEELEKKVENLERIIKGINERVESNLAKINREEIRQNVEKLFDSLTPQFEKYFNEIFKQVAGVLDQGVTYYNMKLAKEADFHKEALTQIVTETFRATEEIVQISRKEQNISEKTEEHLRNILDSKKRWTKST